LLLGLSGLSAIPLLLVLILFLLAEKYSIPSMVLIDMRVL
jgi:hypothetical protein